MKKKRKFGLKKIIIWLLAFTLLAAIAVGYLAYHYVFKTNINLTREEITYLYIPTGSSYEDVVSMLKQEDLIIDTKTFKWVAKQKNYPNHVRAGRYRITAGMNNNELVNMLRSGAQQPLNITFTNIRTKEQLAGHIALRIEADSASIINLLNNDEVMSKYGLDSESAALLFMPNTYEFFWNTSAEQLLQRMHREYHRFWNENRLQKAAAMNMTPVEVGVLASIVQQETTKADEMDRIAGVYINRLKRGMPLQADPTVVFAHRDFAMTRVLKRHLEIDSPYNTYKYRGLPPGPITLPSPAAIDSVLEYEKHEYLYFCAREDFSGYHAFARTYQQHLINARRYQQELNRRNIIR